MNEMLQNNPTQQKKTKEAAKPVKLTVAQLKKHLQGLPQPEMIQLVAECFKLDKEVEQFLTVKFLGEEAVHSLFDVYKKKIEDEFFPERGFGKLRLAEAKKAIKEFEKITRNKEYTLELKMVYVEMGVQFTNAYGDIDERFYASVENMYLSVIKTLLEDEMHDLLQEYKERLLAVLNDTEGIGWGFHDNLVDIFENLVGRGIETE
jgi:hypothetical protein